MDDVFDRYGFILRTPTEVDIVIEAPEWLNDTVEEVWADPCEWDTVHDVDILEEWDIETTDTATCVDDEQDDPGDAGQL